MKLNELKKRPGSNRKIKRVGRGEGSGHGGTACKGHKGQRARSGKGKITPFFEGGQMPLTRRIPKKGFTNIFREEYAIINLGSLNRFNDGDEVSPETVVKTGLVKKLGKGLKVLGNGTLEKKLTIKAHAFSKSARSKIEENGSNIEEIKN